MFAKEYTPTFRGFDSFYGYYLGKADYWDHSNDETYWGLDLHDNLEVMLKGICNLYYILTVFSFRFRDFVLKTNLSLLRMSNDSKILFVILPVSYQQLNEFILY